MSSSWNVNSYFWKAYLGRTFSLPVTMMEGGLDTLDNVEAGDVDADDALDVGVSVGGENTAATGCTAVDGLDCKNELGVVNTCKLGGVIAFDIADDGLDGVAAAGDATLGKVNVEIGMSRPTLARGV